MRPMVSLAMIVRDEAGPLERCLGSVADLVDEVVVVDTGSVDSTPEVARRLGARVFDLPWPDSFAGARNESLRRCRGGWALWLDADEWLEPEARARLSALIAGLVDDESVYLMRQASDLAAGGPDRLSIAQPRLFRVVEGVRWEYRVHEQILEAWRLRGAPIRPTDVEIRHSGYRSADVARGKQARNLRLMELDLRDRPGDPWAALQLGRAYLEGRFPEAERLLLGALASGRSTPVIRRQARALLVRGYRERGDGNLARRAAREGLRDHPGDSSLLFESGCFALQDGDLDAAEAAFRALLEDPEDPEEGLSGTYDSLRGWRSRNHLALVLARQGCPAEAEEQWRLALVDRPDAPEIWLGLGELYLAQGRWDDLGRVVRGLREHATDPDGPFAGPSLLLRAQAHLARRSYRRARALLGRLIGRDPRAADPRMLLGWSHLLEGEDLEAAGRALRDALRIDPAHPEALRGLRALADARPARP